MAIQTFTTGQVLTAAQVNALNSNDFNQTVSAKTASYTLVAADKGTRITMSSTSATTVTINTSLFSAGDTLFIQNLNTGVCTITAGTATVDTSASLALAQHEGGTLYFTSAGVSTFFKAAGATPAAGGGMTLISTTTFDNTVITYTLSSIPQTHKHLLLIGNGLQSNSSVNDTTFFRFNGDTGANYAMGGIANNGGSASAFGDPGNGRIFHPSTVNMARTADASSRFGNFTLNIYDYTATSYKAITYFAGSCANGGGFMAAVRGLWDNTSAITSITFQSEQGSNLKAGTVRLYGVS